MVGGNAVLAIRRSLCLLAGLLAWALFAVPPVAADDSVVLQLKWRHQFQFAGYYAAQEKGFYRDAGLDVTLREGGPDLDIEEEVAAGRANFGIGNSNLLVARQAGRPFVALAVILQHSPEILLTRRQPDIGSVKDLRGRVLMDAPNAVAIAAMLARDGIDYATLPRVPNTGNAHDLVAGKADMLVAYSTNEPFVFEQQGLPYSSFSPRAAGIDFYGDNLFTTEQELNTHPGRVAAFRAASLHGWQYAMQNPEEIADLIIERYGTRNSRAHLLFEAQEMDRLMQPELIPIGEMHPERWSRIAQVFAGAGLMPAGVDVTPLLYHPNSDRRPTWLPWPLAAAAALALVSTAVALRLMRLSRGLQESEARFRALVEDSPVGIFRYGPDLHIAYVNTTFADILGTAAERLLGLDMTTLQDPSVLPAIRSTLRGQSGRYEGAYRSTLSGKRLQVSMTCAPLRAGDGVVIGGIGIVEDITERLTAEGERRNLLAAVEQSPVAVVVTDTNGTIRFVNRAFECNTGYARAEVLGRNPRLLQGGEKTSEDYQVLWDTITDGATWTGEFRNKRKDGSLYWEKAVIAPVRDTTGEIVNFVGVKEDITTKKARDDEIQRLVTHLTETNTELERFAYVASHDLREPLRTIASFSQLLQRRYRGRLDHDADEFIELIVGAASRMHALIGDLLTYSRVTGKGSPFTAVDTAATCAMVLSNLRESIDEAGARVTIGALPTVVGDEVQLMQLFQNLIGNAIKFRRPDTTPTIHIDYADGVFVVADDGIGIGDTDQDIFEIFRRLHTGAAYPGTGIGLAICKRIIQRHGGHIWHQPHHGSGTEFHFTLAPDHVGA